MKRPTKPVEFTHDELNEIWNSVSNDITIAKDDGLGEKEKELLAMRHKISLMIDNLNEGKK